MDRRKLVYYLLLNIFVSATVTGGMLFWYDRNYRAVIQPSVQQVVPANSDANPASTIDPQMDIAVKISSVVGAGTLGAEIVVVKFEGEGQLDLASWQLKDEDGNTFKFPQLTLYPNGAVQVHTITGTDTVIDLYWGIGEAVWSSGENARSNRTQPHQCTGEPRSSSWAESTRSVRGGMASSAKKMWRTPYFSCRVVMCSSTCSTGSG